MKKKRGKDLPREDYSILLVDDEPVAIDVVHEMLGRSGYTIITAESGERAIEVYRSEGDHIDLVILDLNMPEMDGHECLKELLKMDSQVKVIISSGYFRAGACEKLLASGAVAFIRKPYTLKELSHKVSEILNK